MAPNTKEQAVDEYNVEVEHSEQTNDQSVESITEPASDTQVESAAENTAQEVVEEFDKAKAALEKKTPKKLPRLNSEKKQDKHQDNKEKTVVTTKAPPKPKKTGTSKGDNAKLAPKPKTLAPAQKKDGLRQPQVRILQAIAKAGRGLTRVEIAKAADIDPAMGHYLGASRPENYEEYSKKYGFPSLLSLGHLRAEEHEFDGKMKIIHILTASGRKALEKALKENK